MVTHETPHIGQLVKSVFDESGMTVSELARQLRCERTNIYTIFKRRTVDIELLAMLSEHLNHNFLDDAMRLYGLDAIFRLKQDPNISLGEKHRICFKNRNELVLIDPQRIALVNADGNYVYVICQYEMKFHLNYTISDFLGLLHANGYDHFVKIGRSHIVNIKFINRIFPQKRLLLLSDGKTWSLRMELPQKTLKRLYIQVGELFSLNDKSDHSKDEPSSPKGYTVFDMTDS